VLPHLRPPTASVRLAQRTRSSSSLPAAGPSCLSAAPFSTACSPVASPPPPRPPADPPPARLVFGAPHPCHPLQPRASLPSGLAEVSCLQSALPASSPRVPFARPASNKLPICLQHGVPLPKPMPLEQQATAGLYLFANVKIQYGLHLCMLVLIMFLYLLKFWQ
jgi:hypothetical protein